jgi:hypothetical protein
VTLTSDAQDVLTSMAMDSTLRHALNLISCAHVISRKRNAEQVDVEDLRRAYAYLMDEKRRVQWLKEQQGSLVFEEIKVEEGGNIDGFFNLVAPRNRLTYLYLHPADFLMINVPRTRYASTLSNAAR